MNAENVNQNTSDLSNSCPIWSDSVSQKRSYRPRSCETVLGMDARASQQVFVKGGLRLGLCYQRIANVARIFGAQVRQFLDAHVIV